MKRHLRFSSTVLLIAFLLTACITAPAQGTGSNAMDTPTATRAPLTEACPASLNLSATCQTPQTMRQAYGVDSLIQQGNTGKGQTIVDIVSFGSPTLQQDMKTFDSTFHLPPANVKIIAPLNIPESDPHHDKEGWAGETTLDVQIIHALAPDANIVLLVSPVAETEGTIGLPEFRQLEQYAIDHKLGNIVSHSWGASELTFGNNQARQELKLWDALLQKGTTQQGMTYFSSSGDSGATDYTDLNGTKLANVATTSFAADSPWVTSVGGTSLYTKNNVVNEDAWSGSGGGFSRFYAAPTYQKDLPASTQTQFQNRRGVPDVSAVADPFTGMAVYINGQWTQAGGTSASSPVWSAIMAIANQMAGHPLGFINPALYKIAASDTYHQAFHDIVNGNNSNQSAKVQGYSAAPGWDAVTGLGTPNAQYLIPALIKNSH
ncbi:S53 family peptidase [Dictyobacter arantiisoli]|uniref:Peptidase S53 domain-containing protein n=1 Tax=Dictyobacter arantiisoli TaxID=2014874 RepID=A0A5A5T6J1_9CHLR|nr:S53 family peptidase [Dictyobacter arantiisoli]GCF06633.1 hypothetical protein KDI_01970 [Dictyobacter arantiisoli]